MDFSIDVAELLDDEYKEDADVIVRRSEKFNEEEDMEMIFRDSFMEEHTDFSTYQDFSDADPHEEGDLDPHEVFTDEEFEAFIQKRTEFEDAEELLNEALRDYLTHDLEN